jgi:hypothetical protein
MDVWCGQLFRTLPLQKCLETSKNTNVSLELASITGGGPWRHCKTVGFRRKPVRSEVPIGVTMLLAGPSADFVVGRIFENAMGDAFDGIVKKEGMLLPITDLGTG